MAIERSNASVVDAAKMTARKQGPLAAALPSRSALRRPLEWVLLGSLSIAILLWPALYNGFPIVFFDTGGYIAAPRVDVLHPGRGVAYGIFLAAFQGGLDWWPVLAAQAAVAAWLIHLVARVHRLPSGPRALVVTVGVLAVVTSLPWYTAQLMPDSLEAAVVLVLYLLAFRRDRLRRWERAVLTAIGVAAIAVHMAHAALACGLLLVIAVAAWKRRARVGLPALVVALGIVTIPLANAVATGRLAFTPGGQTFVFGRLVQDGIVARFLAERCPSPAYRLCTYKDVLPETADDWIWSTATPFDDIGGWDKGVDEMRRITVESIGLFPLQHLLGAMRNTWTQFWSFETGDGLDEGDDYSYLEYALKVFYPDVVAEYAAARQQTGRLRFATINAVHLPVAFASLALLAAALLWATHRRHRDLADLCAFVMLALLGNAVICGVLSNPHARYQSRIVWLATLCAIIVVQQFLCRGSSRRPLKPCAAAPKSASDALPER